MIMKLSPYVVLILLAVGTGCASETDEQQPAESEEHAAPAVVTTNSVETRQKMADPRSPENRAKADSDPTKLR
jgi:hypothetical protein